MRVREKDSESGYIQKVYCMMQGRKYAVVIMVLGNSNSKLL